MKTALPSHTFLDLRASVKFGIDTKAKLPAITCVLIEQDGRACTFHATDLDMTVSRTEPACGLDLVTGTVLVRMSDLMAIRPDKDTTVYFRYLSPFTTEVRFIAKGLAVTRTVEAPAPVQEFPPLQHLSPRLPARLLPPSTMAAIKTCLPFVSTDQTRYVLNGVFVDPIRGGAAVATDGRRLVKVRAIGLTAPAILPTKACVALTTLITKSSSVTRHEDESILTFRSGPVTISTKAIEGNYPNYLQVIPEPSENRFTLPDPDPLVAWLLTCNDKRSNTVKLTLGRDYLACSSPTGGTVRHPAFIEGKPGKMGLNAIFFAHAIQSGCRTFCMADEVSPLLGYGPNGLTTVVMPMRITDAVEPPAIPEPEQAAA